ncbi:hypothetical protein EYC84_008902 [Monilinia fructicola]|uniref:Uncharacterized protein n=1 Tax=Monilinia fructicola TaxID=38448 RepID=A0A5M9JCI6_MONFR|nr:hypothetical protein EYC84_008902 [Monilinia fructicola]
MALREMPRRFIALTEGLDGEKYEAQRPPIDNAFVVEGLENCSSEGRQKRAEHAGNCWFCGASSDGVRDCEACDGTGCARKGKRKCAKDTPEGPAKKKPRTHATVAVGGVSKPRRGRPPGGKKKKLEVVQEKSHMKLVAPSAAGNNAFEQTEFQPNIPEASYGNFAWGASEHHEDTTLPSYGMDIGDDPFPDPSNAMDPYTSNHASLYQFGAMEDYTVNPQQVDYSTLGHHDHLHPSIEFDLQKSHGEFQIGDVGEGVRSDQQPHLGSSENQFDQFSNHTQHSQDAHYLSHSHDWLNYRDDSLYPPPQDANNTFAPALHNTQSDSVAPATQMTTDRFTPQPPYLPSPTLSVAHISQHAPHNLSSGASVPALTSTATATSAVPANTSTMAPAAPISASRLATPP